MARCVDAKGTRGRGERGSALFVAVLMLAMMGAIGIAALDTATRGRQTAGVQNQAESAFWAAEAGAAEGRSLMRSVSSNSATPNLPTEAAPATLGDPALFDREATLPQYYGDPAFTDPIIFLQDAEFDIPGDSVTQGNGYTYELWRINVVGEGPGSGAPARIQVVATRLRAGSKGASIY